MGEMGVEFVLKTLCSFVSLCVITLISGVATADTAPGERLFITHCASCHGKDGEGFLQVYPPLANSQYLGSEVMRLPCIMRFGMRGRIVADGREFNTIMPGNSRLNTDDIAALTDYLLVRWGDKNRSINVPEWLENCAVPKMEKK